MAGPESAELLERAEAWLDAGHPVALATVIETWGSSPRPRGSQLVVRGDGQFLGSVSGGCVEGAVIAAAQEVLAGAPPRVLEFGVSNEQAWQVGLACGGTIRVFVVRIEGVVEGAGTGAMRRATFNAVRAAQRAQRSAVVVTELATGAEQLWQPGDPPLPEPVGAAIARALATDEAFVLEPAQPAGPRRFVQPFNPPLRLVLVGAVHIAEALAAMAVTAGYAVFLVDPREAFARREPFARYTVSTEWPDEALQALRLDHRCAVVTITHDPKIDDPALEVALRSDAFYVGALGSAKTHAARLERLRARGFGPEALARIHGPVGLKIGAKTPAEVAISALAEITAHLRQGGVVAQKASNPSKEL